MSRKDIINNIRRVIYTLDGIRIDNREGGWDKLLGCLQVLELACDELMKEDADESVRPENVAE